MRCFRFTDLVACEKPKNEARECPRILKIFSVDLS
jgi:hypothetical protein